MSEHIQGESDLWPTKTVYITIGNSDDRLTQREWAAFVSSVARLLRSSYFDQAVVHGQWLSESASSWQNACWCFKFLVRDEEYLKEKLQFLAREFRQREIAYAEVSTVEFLRGIDVLQAISNYTNDFRERYHLGGGQWADL